MSENLVLLFELIGTVAFALSGSITALEKRLDLFGVICLGVITATFGGIFRDFIIGVTPPVSFSNPIYMLTAMGSSTLLFIVAYILKKQHRGYAAMKNYDEILFWMDALGLGIFTVMGVYAAYTHQGLDNHFLCICCGLFTGCGGGMVRDMVVDRLPEIFTRHIYAVASIIGAMITYGFLRAGMISVSMWAGTISVITIRWLARHYRWNLPRIDDYL